jgi:dipeptidyl aminopeptidase/acylaminoacyl peptidase
MSAKRVLIATAACCAGLTLTATTAVAAFPGANGQIAFERSLPGGGTPVDIFAMGPQGESPAPLAANPDNDLEPSYSADGERILFVRSGGDTIWMMNADGSGQTQVTQVAPTDDGDPAFSPDGSRIVFERADASDSDIWVMDADGQNPVQMTNNSTDDTDPSYSPDGRQIRVLADGRGLQREDRRDGRRRPEPGRPAVSTGVSGPRS